MQCWTGFFNPPFDRQFIKTKFVGDMDLVTKNLHGLKWEDGKLPFSLTYTMINYFGNKHQLHVKGREKCLCLQQHTTPTGIDLEQLGCPAKEVSRGCLCRFSLERTCALDKAVRLGHYYIDLFSPKPVMLPPTVESKDASVPFPE